MRINEVILHEELLDVKSVVTSSIKKLDKVFKSNNYELRIVGGAVRDLALDKTPKDIDLATDATPEEMMKILDKSGIRHIPSGLEHGTITAILDNEPYEITTLRADKETDGRHAEVEFVKSWEEDAKRRDLTYNAMSMDMEGNVFDYFGGMDDLQDKVSKFVGDPEERITEDYLRILRYFRFQGRLSTPSWNEDTLKAISSNVKGLQKISVERIWQEMSKVLSGQNVANVLDHMTKTGVSKVIGLSTNDLSKVKDKGNSIVALAQMGNTVDIAKRWRLSNNEAVLLDFLIKNKTNSLDQKKVEDMIADGVNKELITALATLQGKDLNIDAEVPDFPVTGTDLIAKGMNPGPEMGAKLGQLKQQWKQSNFTATKDELLKEVTEFVTLRKGNKMVKVPKDRVEFYLGQHYKIVEKITKSTPMGKVIDDFYKSDAPQFKGKSKAKKRQMAIAAKLSLDEAVHTFMTGHDVTFAGKKYDKIEIEVTGVDNASRKYNIMILSPKELFGKTVAVSSKYMERGPWTKTETPDAFAGEKDAH
jgi:tRNA nucleotidyltransferase (CCA-adding enzyme)